MGWNIHTLPVSHSTNTVRSTWPMGCFFFSTYLVTVDVKTSCTISPRPGQKYHPGYIVRAQLEQLANVDVFERSCGCWGPRICISLMEVGVVSSKISEEGSHFDVLCVVIFFNKHEWLFFWIFLSTSPSKVGVVQLLPGHSRPQHLDELGRGLCIETNRRWTNQLNQPTKGFRKSSNSKSHMIHHVLMLFCRNLSYQF